MRFGELPLDEALGAVLVHTTRAGGVVLKKGRVLRAQDLEALRAAEIATVIVAVLEPDDIAEDAAAHRLALALAGAGTRMDPAKTGRCNVFARHAGLCLVDAAEIARINAIDESITAATIAAHSAVRAGDMVATIKIIPFSVPERLLTLATQEFSFVRNSDSRSFVRDPDNMRSVESDRIDHVRDPDNEIGGDRNVRISDNGTDVRDPDDHAATVATPEAAVVVHPWRGKRAGLVLTRFAETHPSLLAKAEAAQRERMQRCGGELVERRIVAHRAEDVEAALRELAALNLDPILMLGASAIMDRRDVLPAAIERAGGTLIRFGMPVDPGNLLLLARLPRPATGQTNSPAPLPSAGPTASPAIDHATADSSFTVDLTNGATGSAVDHPTPGSSFPVDLTNGATGSAVDQTDPSCARGSGPPPPAPPERRATDGHGAIDVIGVPSCARSLKRSGFDWVLERCCAGIPVTSADIAALGVGGLLDEIDLRPAPRREEAPPLMPPRIAALVLAAGLGSRMEATSGAKLLADLDGMPMVRHAVLAALASRAAPIVVVTGHRADEVRAALADLASPRLLFVHNPDYALGMASSLRAGLGQTADADAAIVCLGDMPRVTAAHIDRIADAFDPVAAPIIVPTHQRKRGNPVLWARRFFAEIEALQGDMGARSLLERHAEEVSLLPLDDPSILLDIDTPAALAALRT